MADSRGRQIFLFFVLLIFSIIKIKGQSFGDMYDHDHYGHGENYESNFISQSNPHNLNEDYNYYNSDPNFISTPNNNYNDNPDPNFNSELSYNSNPNYNYDPSSNYQIEPDYYPNSNYNPNPDSNYNLGNGDQNSNPNYGNLNPNYQPAPNLNVNTNQGVALNVVEPVHVTNQSNSVTPTQFNNPPPTPPVQNQNQGSLKVTQGQLVTTQIPQVTQGLQGSAQQFSPVQQFAPAQQFLAPQQQQFSQAQQFGPSAPQQFGPSAPQQFGPSAPQQFGPGRVPQRQVVRKKKNGTSTGIRGLMSRVAKTLNNLPPLPTLLNNMLDEGNNFVRESRVPLTYLFMGAMAVDMMLQKYGPNAQDTATAGTEEKKVVRTSKSTLSQISESKPGFEIHSPLGSIVYNQHSMMDYFNPINFFMRKTPNLDSF